MFFTLVTATVGELAPVVSGVNLPESRVGATALQQLTLGIGPQVTLGGRPVMATIDAAQVKSTDPTQPLLIPPLYAALRAKADSIRTLRSTPANQSIDAPLAIQARSHHAVRSAVSRHADGAARRIPQPDAAGESRGRRR